MGPEVPQTEMRRLSFGSVAELYDRARPSYPPALVDELIARAGAAAGAAASTGPEGGAPSSAIAPLSALEVGAGTGKATVLLAARGLTVHAIEPDPEMAAQAARNCARFPGVTIEHSDFESAAVRAGAHQLVYAAQSWHWIDHARRYALAREALVPGGSLAAFWNIADWSRCTLAEPLAEAYRRSGAEFVEPGPMFPGERSRLDLGQDWPAQVAAAPGFTDAQTRLYRWTHGYTADAYVALLETHSDHIVLEQSRREQLLADVAATIDRHGGTIELPYATLLCLTHAR